MTSPIRSQPKFPCKSSIPFLPRCQKRTLFISIFNTMIHWSLDSPPHRYDFSIDVTTKQKASSLYVTLRPGLVKFLVAAKKTYCFEIVTFSWWPRDCVSRILKKIDPTGEIITQQLYLDFCLETQMQKEMMDISRTGRMLDRSVIIDGNQNLFVRPWRNAIKLSPYTGTANDVELCSLLKFLNAQKNYVELQDLLHVQSMAPVGSVLPLPSTTRKTLFLDLDETLIFHVSGDGKPPDSYDFTTEWGYFIIRPGVDKLLQAATVSDYEIVIFTAGSRDYAAPVIDKLNPNWLIAHRLYRDSCKRNRQGKAIKDLSLTGRSLDRCIMVDDKWRRVVQRENVVMIKPFKGDMQDSELTKLLPYFSVKSKDEDLLDSVSHINKQLGYLKPGTCFLSFLLSFWLHYKYGICTLNFSIKNK